MLVGEVRKIKGFFQGGTYRARSMSMGLLPGVTFVVQQIAPLGDPIIIQVGSTRIGLRAQEAEVIDSEIVQ